MPILLKFKFYSNLLNIYHIYCFCKAISIMSNVHFFVFFFFFLGTSRLKFRTFQPKLKRMLQSFLAQNFDSSRLKFHTFQPKLKNKIK